MNPRSGGQYVVGLGWNQRVSSSPVCPFPITVVIPCPLSSYTEALSTLPGKVLPGFEDQLNFCRHEVCLAQDLDLFPHVLLLPTGIQS